jgi:flagellar biosynthesis protein FliQ
MNPSALQTLTAVKISMLVFSVVMLCSLVVGVSVSEEHTASNFRAETLSVSPCGVAGQKTLLFSKRFTSK